MIKEEKEIEQEELGIREQTAEDEDNMGNIVDPILQIIREILRMRKLKRGVVL